MIPLDIMSGDFDMVRNNLNIVIFSEGLEVFSPPFMKTPLYFADVEIVVLFQQLC